MARVTSTKTRVRVLSRLTSAKKACVMQAFFVRLLSIQRFSQLLEREGFCD